MGSRPHPGVAGTWASFVEPESEDIMGLFRRKPKEPEHKPCPRCNQLLEREALECPMCGLDLRELYVPTAETRADVA